VNAWKTCLEISEMKMAQNFKEKHQQKNPKPSLCFLTSSHSTADNFHDGL